MNDYRALGSLLAMLAPLGLATSGCDSVIGDFSSRVCQTSSDALAALAPIAGTDFVALRQDIVVAPMIVSQWGTPCATATDVAACEAALAAPVSGEPLVTSGGQLQVIYDVVFTRGDEVTRVSTRAALLDLLGAIDTPNEAALLAFVDHHTMPCDEDNVRVTPDGFVLLGTQGSTCGGDIEHFEITVTSAGQVTLGESEIVEHGDPNCAIGRRPGHLRASATRGRSLGQFFANAAHLEAASVHAFAQLAGELTAHDAPRGLVRAALRSRADEVRHTLATARMARRFGGRPLRPVVGPSPVRSLFEVALDNSTEGCVRETFGALVATVQAKRAGDAHVRRALGRIAVDETRHAALSWAVDAWARRRLPARLRRELDEAQRRAVESLRREVATEWAEDVIAIAGMPRAEGSLRMVAGLKTHLWNA
jgi:hypothetical protein